MEFVYGNKGDFDYNPAATGVAIATEETANGKVVTLGVMNKAPICDMTTYKVVGVYDGQAVVARAYPSDLTGIITLDEAEAQCAEWIRTATL